MTLDINKIKSEFQRIKSLDYIKNIKERHHDGSPGNTFESALGVRENNLKDPDFEGFEVKTKKKLSSSWISMFTKRPDSPENGDNYMRENWGINDEEYSHHKVFRTSLYANTWSTVYQIYKMKILVNNNKERIQIIKADLNEKITDESVYWEFDTINEGVKKLHNTFIVNYEIKEDSGTYYYKYTNALVLLNYIGDKNFLDLINDKTIRYDNRLGIYRSGEKKGQLHNHGGGFRANPSKIANLFNTKIELS